MRPQDVVAGLERNVSDRGRLREDEEEFERGKSEAYDESVGELDASLRHHHDGILASVLAIIEHREPDLGQLELTEQQQSALLALRTAFEGKDARYSDFVYAEHRMELLEQALAALQPALAIDVSAVPELSETYERVVAEVTSLRERLASLEDAQGEEQYKEGAAQEATRDDEDEGGDEAAEQADADTEAGDKPSTLYGDEVPQEPKKSSLGDDEGDLVTAAPAKAERTGVLGRLGRALGLGPRAGKEPPKG